VAAARREILKMKLLLYLALIGLLYGIGSNLMPMFVPPSPLAVQEQKEFDDEMTRLGKEFKKEQAVKEAKVQEIKNALELHQP
jgi:hypothetical protein